MSDIDSSSSNSPPPSSSSSSLFSNGLFSSISPALSQLDSSVNSVYSSQTELAKEIDLIYEKLQQAQSLGASPNFHEFTEKIILAKKRAKKLNISLKATQLRINETAALVRRKEGILKKNKNEEKIEHTNNQNQNETEKEKLDYLLNKQWK